MKHRINSSYELISILSQSGKINLQNELLKALISNNESLMIMLINAGADVNAIYRFGNTYLIQEAVAFENPNLLSILLKNGADVNSVNSSGQTALHLAIILEEIEHIKLLLEYGADPRINDLDGVNALEITNNIFVINLVEEAIKSFTNQPLNELSDPNFLKKTIVNNLKNDKDMRKLNLLHEKKEDTGNCFFESLSKQLIKFNIHHSHESLRALGVNYLLEHLEEYQAFMTPELEGSTEDDSNKDDQVNNYIDDMSSPGTWAEHIIIRASALALGRTISIHRTNGTITQIAPELENEDESIHLDYTGDHYMPHQDNMGMHDYQAESHYIDDTHNIEDQTFIEGNDSHNLNIPLLVLMGLFSCCLSNRIDPS
jgi:hypothetical protein